MTWQIAMAIPGWLAFIGMVTRGIGRAYSARPGRGWL